MKQFVEEALSRMILSASGWRGVFAVDGSEESSAPQIAAAHEEITRRAAWVFADFIKQKTGIKNPAVIVGMDSRPTGPAIAGIAAASLAGCGCEVLWAGIAAAPEIMAYARSLAAENSSVPNAGGFIYISASHNPVGHNGLKFGLLDGGVLGGEDAALLIAAFKSSFEQTLPPAAAARQAMVKEGALAAYRAFIGEVISGDGIDEQALRTVLCSALVKKPLGVVCDFNGSARAASIDLDFFTALNIKFQAINATAGDIAHRIVPEGESFCPAAVFLKPVIKKTGCF